jgi:predicted DNA-binding protein YlxM (UPF0122 family)
MSKLTINEYAHKYQVSRQTVYNRIKKGLIESIEENNKTLIIDEDSSGSNDIKKDSKKDDCKKIVKKLMKRIEKLENKLDRAQDQKLELAMSYVNEMKALYLPKHKEEKKKKSKK